MIENVLIDYLHAGEISVYDVLDHGIYHTLHLQDPMADDEGPARWEPRGLASPRILVPLNIDTDLEECQQQVPLWIEQARQLPGNGTLIVSVRATYTIDDVHYACAGMAYVPQLLGLPLFHVDLTELVLHVFSGHEDLVRETLTHLQGEVRHHRDYQEMADRIVERHLVYEERYQASRAAEKSEMRAAFKRAARLLDRHLTPKQRRELRKKDWFHVVGQDGQRYRIEARSHQNVFLIQNDRPTFQYCLVCKERMPVPDLLLAQKLLLESNIWHFMGLANSWDVRERERPRVRRFPRILPPPPNQGVRIRIPQEFVNRIELIPDYGIAV